MRKIDSSPELRNSGPKRQTFVRRLIKVAGALALLACVGAALVLASLWLEHSSDTTLPTPTGTFAVGRSIQDWVDDTASDPLAPVPGTRRELVVWIWYPSAASPNAARTADYMPAPLRTAIDHTRAAVITNLLTKDLSKVHTHSTPDADVSAQQPSYPVVIMRAGASVEVASYSSLAEDLASHGYIVVGFDAPYRTGITAFPDGRVIAETPENNPERCVGQPQQEPCAARVLAAWSADIGFVLDRLAQLNASNEPDRFKGRLDMTRVGVFGHSFGGAAAAWFCHEDSRCKAGIDLDGAPHGSVIQAGLARPFLFLLSDHSHEIDPQSQQILADIQSIYDRLPPDGRLRITIRGSAHFTFNDDGALLKSSLMRGMLQVTGQLAMDGRRQLQVTAYCVHSFFDAYLKGDGAVPPKLTSPLYPEIVVE